MKDFEITKTKYDYWLSEISSIPLPPWQVNLPFADWKVLSTTDLITEDEMKEVYSHTGKGYIDYCHEDFFWDKIIASWNSLLTHLKLDPEKRYLVLINKTT